MDMHIKRNRLCSKAFAALLIALITAQTAFAVNDKTVVPTHYGKVIGYIYDASTGKPIQDAVTVVEDDCIFADSGKTVSTSDSVGKYGCQGQLGRVS